MEDKDTSETPSESQKEEKGCKEIHNPMSPFSSKLKAMMRIRKKYQAMKKQRSEAGGGLTVAGRPSLRSTSPEIFLFDDLTASNRFIPPKKKRKRPSRVLFPNNSPIFLPSKERSRAKPCLVLLSIIVFVQVYNAIENLDDHVLTYDLAGLEKTLKREVFGQQEATEELLGHLHDYLSTYMHNNPLVLSLQGPSGVGKSHLGRILARHFRSIVGDKLVVQYYSLHHCPLKENAQNCALNLATTVTEVVSWAMVEEKIPIFIFDEVEFMHGPLLDTLHSLLQPDQDNEYLNTIYVMISNLGEAEITQYVLQNFSNEATPSRGWTGRLGRDLGSLLRRVLKGHHPLWEETDIVPLTLLEKRYVMECFLDEMTREGFYPDRSHIERLAGELSYYSAGGRQFSRNGCKQVVTKVNLL